jgi:hypothetical protein
MKLEAGITTGEWTLLERDSTRKYHWSCRCTCGIVKPVRDTSLRNGKSSSCGHDRSKALASSTTHGQTDSPTYKSWQWMKTRVRRNQSYRDRNITVCTRWQDFRNFHADLGDKPAGKRISIERIDNSKGYGPGNCKWSEPKEQSNNRENTVFITSEEFGTRPQQEWVAIMQEHTNDPSWNTRRLKSALVAVKTIDRLLKAWEINLNATCADDDAAYYNDRVAA